MKLNFSRTGLFHTNTKVCLIYFGKGCRYKLRIKFEKDPLAVEQNNYATKIVNAYIVCELDTWPKTPLNNFKLKNCLFGATNTVKNSDKKVGV